jgi:hypothetical protein
VTCVQKTDDRHADNDWMSVVSNINGEKARIDKFPLLKDNGDCVLHHGDVIPPELENLFGPPQCNGLVLSDYALFTARQPFPDLTIIKTITSPEKLADCGNPDGSSKWDCIPETGVGTDQLEPPALALIEFQPFPVDPGGSSGAATAGTAAPASSPCRTSRRR